MYFHIKLREGNTIKIKIHRRFYKQLLIKVILILYNQLKIKSKVKNMNNLSPDNHFIGDNRNNMIRLGLKDRAISSDITANSTSVSHPIYYLSYFSLQNRMIPSIFLKKITTSELV